MNQILFGNSVTHKFYEGCFAADRIPKCVKFPTSMVVNLERSNEDGSHWIGLFTRSASQIFYFDSYGLQPEGLVRKYMIENFEKITRNLKTFQSPFSSVCGHYCIFFIYFMSLNLKFEDVVRMLELSDRPDLFVKNFISSFV